MRIGAGKFSPSWLTKVHNTPMPPAEAPITTTYPVWLVILDPRIFMITGIIKDMANFYLMLEKTNVTITF